MVVDGRTNGQHGGNGQPGPETTSSGQPELPPLEAAPVPFYRAVFGHPWVRRVLLWIKDAITRNFPLKALSFALAVALWVRVSEDQTVTETVPVKLVIERPDDLILLDPPGDTMAIQVVAPRSKIKALHKIPLEMTIDLTHAGPGEMDFSPVGQRIRNLPPGVQISAYMPSSFHFTFDEKMTRTLKIQVPLEGKPAPGYRVVGTPRVEPASVDLVGPAGILGAMFHLETEPVDISDATRTITGRYALNLSNPLLRVVNGREDVLVTVEIAEEVVEKTLAGLKVEIPETMGHCAIEPDEVEVVLEGPSEAVKRIEPSDVRIFLQEGSKPLGELQRPHTLRYPAPSTADGLPRITVSWPHDDVVKLKRISPHTFTFRVLEAPR